MMNLVTDPHQADPMIVEALVRATAFPYPPEDMHRMRHNWVVSQMMTAHPGLSRELLDLCVSRALGFPVDSRQDVTLAHLRRANLSRQAEWCPDQLPDLSFRGNELGGECGEAQNVIKKLERERLGWAGSRATKAMLAEELADVVICADLCAATADIDLGAAVVAKFNAKSEEIGLSTRLDIDQT